MATFDIDSDVFVTGRDCRYQDHRGQNLKKRKNKIFYVIIMLCNINVTHLPASTQSASVLVAHQCWSLNPSTEVHLSYLEIKSELYVVLLMHN